MMVLQVIDESVSPHAPPRPLLPRGQTSYLELVKERQMQEAAGEKGVETLSIGGSRVSSLMFAFSDL